jgi:hypothetical protein
MPVPVPPEARRAFASLSELVYAGSSADEVLGAIVQVAVEVVPGVDHACVSTLTAPRTLTSRAASDEVALLMDQLENEASEGPCLDSILEDSFQRDDDIATRSTWPRLAELTLARTPVRGMIGYRLLPDTGTASALNLFSDQPGALTDEAADIGAVLAAFTSVALTAIEQRSAAENLRRGLESNREIGKAIGLLMATHRISDTEAFELLRKASSRTNTRLALLAQRIADGHRAELGREGPAEVRRSGTSAADGGE